MEMDINGTGPSVPGGMSPVGGAPHMANGTVLGERFQIEGFIGPTLYGDLYRARDSADGRFWSVKVLYPALVVDPKVREELLREAQVAARLEHKNVAQSIGVFEGHVGAEAVTYQLLELLDGQSLREMLEKKRVSGKPFSLKGTYNVIAHLCNALTYAHGTTNHGGLAPDSIQVSTAGRVKVCDFGLARTLGGPGANPNLRAALLPALPPEARVQPEPIDSRADLYSVGTILYELLTTRQPGDPLVPPSRIVPGLPSAVDRVVERCLAWRREDRFADPQAIKEALHAAVAGDGAAKEGDSVRGTPPTGTGTLSSAPPSAPGAPTASTAPTAPNHGSRPTAAPRPPAAPPSQPGAPAGLPGVARPRAAAPQPQPQRAAAAPPGVQRPQIAASFNVDSALSAIDDSTERWLIQKDKLDFGPFNMRDVRAQIETGKILGEHIIVDSENGERRRVKDHPQLRDAVVQAERQNAERLREAAEADERRKHKGKVITLLGVMLVVVVGVLGGGFLYGRQHHWFEQKVVKEVVHDNEFEFMKGVEISLKVDPPAPKKHTTHRPKKGGKPGEFDEVTNLGDASEGGGDETLDQAVVQRVMTANFKVLVGCIAEERRRNPSLHTVDMDFIIKGTGNVSAVKVNGQTGTPIAGCMYGKMQSVAFPKFNGSKTHASFSLALK
jgi:serine/threonine-protein kinase